MLSMGLARMLAVLGVALAVDPYADELDDEMHRLLAHVDSSPEPSPAPDDTVPSKWLRVKTEGSFQCLKKWCKADKWTEPDGLYLLQPTLVDGKPFWKRQEADTEGQVLPMYIRWSNARWDHVTLTAGGNLPGKDDDGHYMQHWIIDTEWERKENCYLSIAYKETNLWSTEPPVGASRGWKHGYDGSGAFSPLSRVKSVTDE